MVTQTSSPYFPFTLLDALGISRSIAKVRGALCDVVLQHRVSEAAAGQVLLRVGPRGVRLTPQWLSSKGPTPEVSLKTRGLNNYLYDFGGSLL